MGLHQNGFRDNVGVFRFAGAGLSNGAYPSTLPINTHLTGAQRNLTAGQGISDDKVGIPLGYLAGGSWMLPQKPGNMSARYTAEITVGAIGSGVGGITTTGTSSLTFTVADADGQLISSGSGAASLTFTVADALLVASLGGSGSAALTLSTNNALLGAIASLTAEGSFTINGTLQPYAIGQMAGSTVDTSVLTTAAILAAMNASPPGVNIKLVNDIWVSGDGQPGSEWGPN